MQNYKERLDDQREHYRKEIRRQDKMQLLQKKRQLMMVQQNDLEEQMQVLALWIIEISAAIKNNDGQAAHRILEAVCEMLASESAVRINAFNKSGMVYFMVRAGNQQWSEKSTAIREIIIQCFNRFSMFEVPEENDIVDSRIVDLMIDWLPLMSRGELLMCIQAFTYSLEKEKLFKLLWNYNILNLLRCIHSKIGQDDIIISAIINFVSRFMHYQSSLFDLGKSIKPDQVIKLQLQIAWMLSIANTFLSIFMYADYPLQRDNAFEALAIIRVIVNCGVTYTGNPKMIVDLLPKYKRKSELSMLTVTLSQIVYQSDRMAIQMAKNSMLIGYLLKILTDGGYADEKRRVARILSNLATIDKLQNEIGAIIGCLVEFLLLEDDFSIRKEVFRVVMNWAEVRNFWFTNEDVVMLRGLNCSEHNLTEDSVQTIFWLKMSQRLQGRLLPPRYIRQILQEIDM